MSFWSWILKATHTPEIIGERVVVSASVWDVAIDGRHAGCIIRQIDGTFICHRGYRTDAREYQTLDAAIRSFK